MRRRQQPAVECLAAVAECTKTSQPHNRYVHIVFTLPAPLVPVSTRSSSRSGSENTRFWADGRQSGSWPQTGLESSKPTSGQVLRHNSWSLEVHAFNNVTNVWRSVDFEVARHFGEIGR